MGLSEAFQLVLFPVLASLFIHIEAASPRSTRGAEKEAGNTWPQQPGYTIGDILDIKKRAIQKPAAMASIM